MKPFKLFPFRSEAFGFGVLNSGTGNLSWPGKGAPKLETRESKPSCSPCVAGFGFQVSGFVFQVSGFVFRFRVSDFGLWISRRNVHDLAEVRGRVIHVVLPCERNNRKRMYLAATGLEVELSGGNSAKVYDAGFRNVREWHPVCRQDNSSAFCPIPTSAWRKPRFQWDIWVANSHELDNRWRYNLSQIDCMMCFQCRAQGCPPPTHAI